MKTNNKLIKLLDIFLPLILGGICSIFIKTNVYKSLVRPPLAPPGWIFPVVWSILYLLMGISFYMAKNEVSDDKMKVNYYIGLAVNLAWPFIFFNARLYLLGALWIVLIIGLLISLLARYYQIKKKAAYLQLPYFFWLLFALYLNIGVVILN